MKRTNEMRGLVKFGCNYPRRKTKVDEHTAVFNECSATDCRNRYNGNCKLPEFCYALLPEIDFRAKVVLPYRRAQEQYFLSHTAEQFCEDFLQIAKARKVAKCTHLRVAESGDFHDQACFEKWVKIANILHEHEIIVYAYTCSHDLDFSNRGHLILVGSGKEYDSQFIVKQNHIEAYRQAKARGENAYLCGSGCGGKCDACGQVGARIYAKLLKGTSNYLKSRKRAKAA